MAAKYCARFSWVGAIILVLSLLSIASAQLPPPAPVPDEEPLIDPINPPTPEVAKPELPAVEQNNTTPAMKSSSKPLPTPSLPNDFHYVEKAKTKTAAKPGQFCIQLQDGTRLTGSLAEIKSLPLQLDFAKIEIPSKYIQSVMVIKPAPAKKNKKDDQPTAKNHCVVKVELQNGDLLTGKLMLLLLSLDTDYGQMKLPVEKIYAVAAGNNIPAFAQNLSSPSVSVSANSQPHYPTTSANSNNFYYTLPPGSDVRVPTDPAPSAAEPKIGDAKPLPR